MGSRRRGSASSTLPERKMVLKFALLLLLATGVLSQEEAAEAETCDKDCEESWEYVEFLKKDISDEVTEILTNFKTTQEGDNEQGYGCERNNLEENQGFEEGRDQGVFRAQREAGGEVVRLPDGRHADPAQAC